MDGAEMGSKALVACAGLPAVTLEEVFRTPYPYAILLALLMRHTWPSYSRMGLLRTFIVTPVCASNTDLKRHANLVKLKTHVQHVG